MWGMLRVHISQNLVPWFTLRSSLLTTSQRIDLDFFVGVVSVSVSVSLCLIRKCAIMNSAFNVSGVQGMADCAHLMYGSP